MKGTFYLFSDFIFRLHRHYNNTSPIQYTPSTTKSREFNSNEITWTIAYKEIKAQCIKLYMCSDGSWTDDPNNMSKTLYLWRIIAKLTNMGNELCDNTVSIAILCSAFWILPVLLAMVGIFISISNAFMLFLLLWQAISH